MDTAKCLRYNFEKNYHIVQLIIIFYNLRDQNSNDKYINTLKYLTSNTHNARLLVVMEMRYSVSL